MVPAPRLSTLDIYYFGLGFFLKQGLVNSLIEKIVNAPGLSWGTPGDPGVLAPLAIGSEQAGQEV